MRGAHKMEKVLSECLLVFRPGCVRHEHPNLIQLEALGIIQVAFRDCGIVLKPEFSMADGFGRLVVESPDAAQIPWHMALRSNGQAKSGYEQFYCKAMSSHGSSGSFRTALISCFVF